MVTSFDLAVRKKWDFLQRLAERRHNVPAFNLQQLQHIAEDDDFSIFPNHVPNVVRSIDFIFYPFATVQSDHMTAGAMAAQCRIYDGSLCVGGDEGR